MERRRRRYKGVHEEGAEIDFISSNDSPVKEFPPFPHLFLFNQMERKQTQSEANGSKCDVAEELSLIY